MRALRPWLIAAAVLGIVGWLIWGRVQAEGEAKAKQDGEMQARRGGAASVEIARTRPGTLIESIEAVGTAASPFTVNLSPRVAGRITYLEVREGDSVAQGQVVARIDGEEAGARVLQNQANVSEARSRLAQAQATVQSNDVQIQQAIVRARAELSSAQADLARVRADVEGRTAEAASTAASSRADLNASLARERSAAAQAKAAEARLESAQSRLRRLTALFQQGYRSAQEVEDAQTEAAAAQASVDVAQASVETAQAETASSRAQLQADEAGLRSERSVGAAEIKSAEARIAQAESSLAQAQANRAQSPAYRENVKALEAGVKAADAQLKAAGVGQAETSLKSPIKGIITARNADPGSIASPGQPVARIEFLDWLYVDARVPVAESSRVKKGLPVSISFDGLDEPFFGTVDQAVPSADSEDRQFLVKVKVQNPDRRIRPGMFARLSIEISRYEAGLLVPQEAVSERGTATVVGSDGKAAVRPVRTGRRQDSLVEILEGLNPGDQVVVLSYNPVRDGSDVQVTAERMADGSRKAVERPEPEGQGRGQGQRGGR